MTQTDTQRLELLQEGCQKVRQEVGRVVVGQESVVEQLLIAALAGGHVLLVGVPGLAKTLLVASLARCLDLSFGRVQFTPDLLPADITGTDVIQEVQREGRSERSTTFLAGPIFAHVVLADEINRTPPKTQAALLQAMQEGHVTVGGATHPLPQPFLVLATRNPIEQEGTYPLPEAQLDRFLLEVLVEYPSEEEEWEIARRPARDPGAVLSPVLSAEQVSDFRALIPRIPVAEEAVQLAVRLARRSRPESPDASPLAKKFVRFGAGPRGSRALVSAAQARAALLGRAAADLEDVRAIALPCLRHRLVMSFRAEAEAVSADQVVAGLLDA